jgi:hypothetical protein
MIPVDISSFLITANWELHGRRTKMLVRCEYPLKNHHSSTKWIVQYSIFLHLEENDPHPITKELIEDSYLSLSLAFVQILSIQVFSWIAVRTIQEMWM